MHELIALIQSDIETENVDVFRDKEPRFEFHRTYSVKRLNGNYTGSILDNIFMSHDYYYHKATRCFLTDTGLFIY